MKLYMPANIKKQASQLLTILSMLCSFPYDMSSDAKESLTNGRVQAFDQVLKL